MTLVTERRRAAVLMALLTASALVAVACGQREGGSPSSPSAVPSATAAPKAQTSGGGEGATVAGPQEVIYPPEGEAPLTPKVINFPPRNEPNAFFFDLQVLYRDVLRRPQTAPSYVDGEGENVWLTEYFRFYLNGCAHDVAVSRTLQEITTGASLPTCGFERTAFPSRDLPNAFQVQLELTYRDVLRRPLLVSYVDSEGANVWLAEYLRYRISGCGHADSENRVFTQIRGGGVQPDCFTGGGGGGGGTSTITGTVAPLGINRHNFTVTGGSGTVTMALALAWNNAATDLDMYLTSTSCTGYPPRDCQILGASQRNSGTTESITRGGVRTGDQFSVWVDNFSNRSESYAIAVGFGALTTTGGSLQITETSVEQGVAKPAGFSKGN